MHWLTGTHDVHTQYPIVGPIHFIQGGCLEGVAVPALSIAWLIQGRDGPYHSTGTSDDLSVYISRSKVPAQPTRALLSL